MSLRPSIRHFVESLTGPIRIVHWSDDDHGDEDSPYDPYIVADQAEAIFKKCGIRANRGKDIRLLAFKGEVLIGATMAETEYHEDEEHGSYCEYSFDIAVDPDAQGGTAGYMLTLASVQDAKAQSDGGPVLMKNWVINPVMERMLHKLFGFTDGDEARHGGGSCHQEKWL